MEPREELRARLIGTLKPSCTPGDFDCPLCLEGDALHIYIDRNRDDDPGYLWSIANFCACELTKIAEKMGLPCRWRRRPCSVNKAASCRR